MGIVKKVLERLNIQVFIMFLSTSFILYTMKLFVEYRIVWEYTKYMLYISILNLVIIIVLYIFFLNNRIRMDRLAESKEVEISNFADSIKKELNYILYSLIIFCMYIFFYFVYVLCRALSQ